MKIRSYVASLCVLLLLAPWTYAQEQPQPDRTPRLETEREHWYSGVTRPYTERLVPPVNLSNSSRLESLIRAGNLYLSLADAVALAIENNIDIEVTRYNFQLAETDLTRANAGGAIRGVSTAVQGGGGGVGGIQNVAAGAGATGVVGTGGTAIPSFDPVLTSNISWGHNTQILANTIQTGNTSLVSVNKNFNFQVSQGFKTGATAQMSFNNLNQFQNAPRNIFNPVTQSFLDLQISQPLLRGFGLALNTRNIRVAKNNMQLTDYTFQQQLITTINSIAQM
jgi:hypothetical protein